MSTFILADRTPFEICDLLDSTFRIEDDTAIIEADLEPGYYRCDICTEPEAFDFSKLYVKILFGGGHKDDIPNHPDAPVTGPWDFITEEKGEGGFLLPKPEVYQNEERLGECWFDMPEIREVETKQLHAGFGFKVTDNGKQILKMIFRPADGVEAKSIIGAEIRKDERSPVQEIKLTNEKDIYPRLFFSQNEIESLRSDKELNRKVVWEKFQAHISNLQLQFDNPAKQAHGGSFMAEAGMAWSSAGMFVLTGENEWLEKTVSYSASALGAKHWGRQEPETMGCDNDIVAGRTLFKMSCIYDWLHGHADAEWLEKLEKKIIHHARIMYKFSVFQRDYWPTGFSQNHCWSSMHGLIAAGFLFAHKSEEALEWLTWSRRIMDGYLKLQSQDGTGGCQADICYGGQFFIRAAEILLYNTGESIYDQPFYNHVIEYLDSLHRLHYPASGFAIAKHIKNPTTAAHVKNILDYNPSVDFLAYLWYEDPDKVTGEVVPTRYFPDGGHALFRTKHKPALDLLFSCAGPLPHSVLGNTSRYEGGHATPNMGQFTAVFEGDDFDHSFLCNAGRQTYKRLSRTANVITFDGKGQWGEDFVWYPTLQRSQVGEMTEYQENDQVIWSTAEMKNAYPQERGVKCWQRTVMQWQSDIFVFVDIIEAEGPESTEWWCHSSGTIEDKGDNLYLSKANNKQLWLKNLLPDNTESSIAETDYIPMPAVIWDRENHLCLKQKVAKRNYFVTALAVENDFSGITVETDERSVKVYHEGLGGLEVCKGKIIFNE
ncbi:MAG: hypothetical protein ACYTFY_19655 [Planctomycetota bacterium]|jgi:hypothetical protein